MTSLYLNLLFKGPVSKHSLILRTEGEDFNICILGKTVQSITVGTPKIGRELSLSSFIEGPEKGKDLNNTGKNLESLNSRRTILTHTESLNVGVCCVSKIGSLI